MMLRYVLAALLAVSLTAYAQDTGAPKGRCQFQFDNTPNTSLTTFQLPSKQYNSFLGNGVVARCPSQKIVLKSDSLEQYGDEGRYFFIGHVDYKEPRLALKADFLTYFQRDERLLAFSNVDATLPSGSKLKGSSLEFFRAIPKLRPKQRGVSIGRPTISIIEKDPQGKTQPPVTVTGNTVWLEGDSVVASSGEVVVVRPELTATGDSLYLDNGAGTLRLMRKPRMVGTKGRPFTLVGETIDLLSRRRKLERVLSKSSAEATSEDLNLKSDTIDMRVTDDLLQRATAWGKGRARATSPQQTIVSDSIDVLMPGQRVREMHAVRNAVAEGAPDTTKFHTTEKDRLMGDTIIAYFDSIPARDTTSKPRIRMLVAIGHASSLQHLPPQDTTLRKPDINYICGQRITVTFDSAKVKNVKMEDSKPPCGGIYAQAEADSSTRRKNAPGVAAPPPAGRPVPTPTSVAPAPVSPVKKP
ncbi:MAG: hypothetical protein JWL61_1776 [Gemmatimonadetes bacterium]|jgi:lipopolysaccharide export system protein LptA|nr:hypothetical protein [Gemmatimonadota bacterium]